MTASDILQKYISFFEKKDHTRIPNSPLVPQNDPTTLFTSSGMQPLVPYLLGEKHPAGKRLVNVQNCFRAQDIDEIGDNRHTTFFRMLGNWSLGDYFKAEQIPWFWEFLTSELGLPVEKLYVSVFNGFNDIEKDKESEQIWKKIFEDAGLDARERINFYGVDKNWWSRAGLPQNMPEGEPGGPDTEVFFDFGTPHNKKFGESCNPNCGCGRFLEIGNCVFMQYVKKNGMFEELPQRNVDFGGGLERLLAASENQNDIFQTSLLGPIIKSVEKVTGKPYEENNEKMRIVIDHFVASSFIISAGVTPDNKEQGYILRRLIRRGLDNLGDLETSNILPVLKSIVSQYKTTDEKLTEKFEKIKGIVLEEQQGYKETQERAREFIHRKYPLAAFPKGGQVGQTIGDEIKGLSKISAEDAFVLYSTHGLSPTQIKSLGFVFNNQEFARKMEEHQQISRAGAVQKFAGGLADHSEKTVLGHTATHLLHQAIRNLLGENIHQTGSNITSKRLRFDFNYSKALTDDEIKKLEDTVNQKIEENLSVRFEMLPLEKAKEIGAIGLFDEKYQEDVKVYFIGPSAGSGQEAYSKEFCGGPHVDFTGELKRFTIIKQENIGRGQRRIYAQVG
ncbi:MAG: alanine--tRNA ligase [Candidatus Levyibacteriota bacterium]